MYKTIEEWERDELNNMTDEDYKKIILISIEKITEGTPLFREGIKKWFLNNLNNKGE